MKRVIKSLSKEYIAVKIYLDDLEKIQTILKESASDFEIETEEYKFISVEELCSKYKNQKLNTLKISTSRPYINIELGKMWVRLYCGSDDTATTGVFYKLNTILSARSRKPTFLYSYYAIWIGNILIFPIEYIFQRHIPTQPYVILQILNLIWILWTFWIGYIRLFKSSEIVVTERGNLQNFYTRNKDQIIVGLINVTIGAALGIIGTLISHYYFKFPK